MNWRSEQGYTMLELLAVLAIAGLVFALAVPLLPRAAQSASPAAAASRLIAQLETLRARAMREGRAIPVAFSDEAAAQTGRFEGEVLEGPGGVWRAAHAAQPLTGARLTFYPDGTATPGQLEVESLGGRIRLAARPFSGSFEIVSGDAKQ